eukprot:1872816-Prymnesium_polylepis.1
MARIKDDIIVFVTYAFVFIVAFGSAFVGLMPALGDGPFMVNGAFFAPFWSMYGEFGELGEVGQAGGPLSTSLLWVYTFLSQIVLVNLLIAMMTETYESVKENADNEWRFRRVSTIDEAASAAAIPPPLSLPVLLMEMGQELLSVFKVNCTSWLGDLGKIGQLSLYDPMSADERVGSLRPDLVWLSNLGDEWALRRKEDQSLHLDELKKMGEQTLAKLLENQELLLKIVQGGKVAMDSKGGMQVKALDAAAAAPAGGEEQQLRAMLKDANEVSKKREEEVRRLKAQLAEAESKSSSDTLNSKAGARLLAEERQANA